jgi:hypothetical protein
MYLFHYWHAKTKIACLNLYQAETVLSNIRVTFNLYLVNYLEFFRRNLLPIVNNRF